MQGAKHISLKLPFFFEHAQDVFGLLVLKYNLYLFEERSDDVHSLVVRSTAAQTHLEYNNLLSLSPVRVSSLINATSYRTYNNTVQKSGNKISPLTGPTNTKNMELFLPNEKRATRKNIWVVLRALLVGVHRSRILCNLET
jgi:hypothetical protein